MAKKKVSHNDTIFQSNTNYDTSRKIIGQYHDLFSGRQKPVSDQMLEHIAIELVEWVERDTASLKLKKFYELKRMHERTFQLWADRCENLRLAKEYVLMVLGNRREEEGLRRNLDSNMVCRTMPIYDDDWRKLEEWRSKLTEKANAGNVTVVMESFPSSDEVKEKKEEHVKKISPLDLE